MSAVLLKGAEVGKRLLERLKAEMDSEKRRRGHAPVLLLIKIGDAPDAEAYARSIRRILAETGAEVKDLLLSSTDEKTAAERIHSAASARGITGALLLSPVPSPLVHGNLNRVIPPQRDVEGAENGAATGAFPPTALSCLELALASGIQVQGAEAVVVGRSPRVGRPTAELLLSKNATVTVCHSKTRDLAFHVKRADILVAAVGRPGLVKGEWIKPGAVVVDAGENFVNGKLLGDVEFDKAAERAGFITPVPAGVGPLTTYMLAHNLIELSKRHAPQ